jgi:hypothetical protein
MKTINKIIITTAALFTMTCSGNYLAAADIITIDSVTGTWGSIIGGQNVSGAGTNSIFWGSAGDERSGYNFQGNAPPIFPVDINTPFNLGTFTHFNEPIPVGSAITGARLTTKVDLTINGVQQQGLTFVYDFLHNETPNVAGQCPPGSVSVCDDIVALTNNTPLSDSFFVNGVNYTINVSGFMIGGSTFTQFLTQENKTNSAILQASIASIGVAVPEPSTYLIMGSTLLLAYWFSRTQVPAKARK